MGINTKQLKELIIIPTLDYLELNSLSAQNLLLGTCAQESQMGTYLKQVSGPALGIYQIEPRTHTDLLDNYLYNNNKNLLAKVKYLASQKEQFGNKEADLITNLSYATAIARIFYLRVPEKLPEADDIEGMARFYKKYYNTSLGAATEQQFIENYKYYVL